MLVFIRLLRGEASLPKYTKVIFVEDVTECKGRCCAPTMFL